MGASEPSEEAIENYLFGPSSPLFRVFHDQLGWEHEKFSCWLRTFSVQSAYRVSATQLYRYDRVGRDGLAEEKDYIAMWKEIGEALLPEDQDKDLPGAPESFWMKLEKVGNEMLKELVCGMLHKADSPQQCFRAVWDDDKVHVASKVYHDFLKMSQHI